MLTVEDLESLPEDGNRYEIVDGELFVSTGPGIIHQAVLARLLGALFHFLEAHRLGYILPGVGVVFDEHNAVIPDLV